MVQQQHSTALPQRDFLAGIPSEIPNQSYGSDNFSMAGDSLVSEVTMMTYSDEKAAMIKEEFLRRLNDNKSYTLKEKAALLREIQEDQYKRFRNQEELEKLRKKAQEEGARLREQEEQRRQEVGINDFFKSLNRLRLAKLLQHDHRQNIFKANQQGSRLKKQDAGK